MTLDDSSGLSEFNDENICCICSELYCKDVKNWFKCSYIGCLYCNPRNAACSIVGPCESWAHEVCTDDTIRFVGSVVEWLKRRARDQHGLGSKPSRAILLCPWERQFTALSPAW